MHGFYIEKRKISPGMSLSRDLAQHIFTRAAHGPVVVIAEKPQDLAAVTKKQWNALIRLVQRERASTLRAARIAELTNQINWMQRVLFTTKQKGEPTEGCVFFTIPESATAKPPICSTLYITQKLDSQQFTMAASWLPKNSVVVVYNSAS